MCTGMIAAVRALILAATSATLRHQVSASQSTSTGRQPASITAPTQETIVKLGRMTSESRGSASACIASASAMLPLHTATPCVTPQYSAQRHSNSVM